MRKLIRLWLLSSLFRESRKQTLDLNEGSILACIYFKDDMSMTEFGKGIWGERRNCKSDTKFLALGRQASSPLKNSFWGWLAGLKHMSQGVGRFMCFSRRPLNLLSVWDKSLSLCRQAQTNMEATFASLKQKTRLGFCRCGFCLLEMTESISAGSPQWCAMGMAFGLRQ